MFSQNTLWFWILLNLRQKPSHVYTHTPRYRLEVEVYCTDRSQVPVISRVPVSGQASDRSLGFIYRSCLHRYIKWWCNLPCFSLKLASVITKKCSKNCITICSDRLWVPHTCQVSDTGRGLGQLYRQKLIRGLQYILNVFLELLCNSLYITLLHYSKNLCCAKYKKMSYSETHHSNSVFLVKSKFTESNMAPVIVVMWDMYTLLLKCSVFTAVIRRLSPWWHLAPWTSNLLWLTTSSWNSLWKHLRQQELEPAEPSRSWLHAASDTRRRAFVDASLRFLDTFWLRTAIIPTYSADAAILYYGCLLMQLPTYGCWCIDFYTNNFLSAA